MKKYWLMKSEPDTYSIDNLAKDKTTIWEGVRNYQARNFMTQEMSVGDEVLFYHSNATPPGVAGLAKVSKPAMPDPSAFDKKSDYYEPKATSERPIWECVEVKYVDKFKHFISLEELKKTSSLKDMILFKRSRLSIQPVSKKEFEIIVKLGNKKKA